jgi:hypothetical protein
MKGLRFSTDELFRWLYRGRAFWFGIIAIVVLYLMVSFPVDRIWPVIAPSSFTDRIRWLGILLEVLSISLIAYELSKSLVTFQGQGMRVRVCRYLADSRFIFIKRPPFVLKAENLHITVKTGVAIATTVTKGGTLEQRLSNLENDLRAAQNTIGMLSSELRGVKDDFRQVIDEEAKKHQESLSEVRRSLEEHAVGDPATQMAGLVLLVLSIFLANAPEESASVLKFLGLGSHAYW